MNKFGYLLATTALAGLAAWPGTAEAQSSKAVAKVHDLSVIDFTDEATHGVFSLPIKTANKSDLFVDVSLQCGLTTTTKVVNATETGGGGKTGKKGAKSSALAGAKLAVTVTIDGRPSNTVHPSVPVTFCERSQLLEATLGQALICEDLNSDGTIQFETECDLIDQDISLTLVTLNANSFNFIIPDVGSGDHTISINAILLTATSGTAGATAVATGLLGLGSVTVQEVRMIKDFDVTS